ncbi:MAG TPA: hypothetical protein VF222_04285 [Nitrososphaeraceae archaeon]
MTDVSINEDEKHLVLFALNQLAEMIEDGNLKEEDFKDTEYSFINLSSIYELKDRLEAEIM